MIFFLLFYLFFLSRQNTWILWLRFQSGSLFWIHLTTFSTAYILTLSFIFLFSSYFNAFGSIFLCCIGCAPCISTSLLTIRFWSFLFLSLSPFCCFCRIVRFDILRKHFSSFVECNEFVSFSFSLFSVMVTSYFEYLFSYSL